MSKKLKRARWSFCNVLQSGTAESRHLWTFQAGKNGFSLDEDLVLPVDAALPAAVVARDWKGLFQPKLNIALLPVDKVFLRVVQLPVSEFSETLSMVELQLEKLSPLPVTQIAWSVQVLPHTVDNLQTIVVIIASREGVEQLLGKLEGQGFVADRLELPILDQLLATPITGDGAWIYPVPGTGNLSALVAWWYGGVLRNLGLVHIPDETGNSQQLKEQLTQMAWAGELEGWLTSPPHWHLVATEMAASSWQPMFRAWLNQPADVFAPLSELELAALTANRAARADSRATILPAEFSSRYRQQYVDRLWMRGLGAVVAIYVVIVAIYSAALSFQESKAQGLNQQSYSMSLQYTNALKLKNQLQILQDREALKYASLDCWLVVAQLLPAGFTVQSMDFADGKSLRIRGVAPKSDSIKIVELGDRLGKYTTPEGQLVFSDVVPTRTGEMPNGMLEWGYNMELAKTEDLR